MIHRKLFPASIAGRDLTEDNSNALQEKNTTKDCDTPKAQTRFREYLWTAAIGVGCVFAFFCYGWWSTGSIRESVMYMNGQRLFLKPSAIDLGNIKTSEIINISFGVRNLSVTPVKLIGAKKTCSCISIDSFPQVILPREEKELVFSIQAPQHTGTFTQSLTAYTDADAHFPLTLTVKGVAQ